VLLVNGVVGGVLRSSALSHARHHPGATGRADRDPRRQLEDEVDLVGAVMEARGELTVGTVTVDPHA
jgi:hypothetical protein